VVVADEPVSALDVSVQAAIINLLNELQASHGTTLVFISHDLSVVRYLADHVAVMYLGSVLEHGPVDQVFTPPYHPVHRGLAGGRSGARSRPRRRARRAAGHDSARARGAARLPAATRCLRKVGAICDDTPPPVQRLPGEHRIACHIPGRRAAHAADGPCRVVPT
jgi:peptide/nickel transport system ATP-binding protein